MTIGVLMDEHVKSAITAGLRQLGADVLTAQEDGSAGLTDEELLDRATVLGRFVFTFDKDFLAIAAARQRRGQAFAGVVFANQSTSVARCIDDLAALCLLGEAADIQNSVQFITVR
jgi:predicted nuclease of predicted toxin-antitoxin system